MNVAMFVALGFGLRGGVFGPWSVALGLLCGLGLFLCFHWSADIEDRLERRAVVLGGAGASIRTICSTSSVRSPGPACGISCLPEVPSSYYWAQSQSGFGAGAAPGASF